MGGVPDLVADAEANGEADVGDEEEACAHDEGVHLLWH